MSHQLANAHSKPWLLLGATGLTGRMVLERVAAAGLTPTLAGRNLGRLRALAEPFGFACVAVNISDPASLATALAGKRLVLNAAGLFSTTALPVIEAAMAAGVDYIDLSGEHASLAALLRMNDRARAAGVALVGGAGFGVAATDGLAMQVDAALGGAETLRIAVATDSGFATGGVAESTIEVLRGGGLEVAHGATVPARLARHRWTQPGASGAVAFASAPLAEIEAVRVATCAQRIIAGVPMPGLQARVVAAMSPILPHLLKIPSVARAMANTGGHGGAADAKRIYRSLVWVDGYKGQQHVGAQLEGGEGFALAADIASLALQAALEQRLAPGAYTPATAFGAHFIDQVPGVRITLRAA